MDQGPMATISARGADRQTDRQMNSITFKALPEPDNHFSSLLSFGLYIVEIFL